jgi:hypothetical protein
MATPMDESSDSIHSGRCSLTERCNFKTHQKIFNDPESLVKIIEKVSKMTNPSVDFHYSASMVIIHHPLSLENLRVKNQVAGLCFMKASEFSTVSEIHSRGMTRRFQEIKPNDMYNLLNLIQRFLRSGKDLLV